MNTTEGVKCASCPYYLEDMQACGLHPYGIYLPHREHLLTYCLSFEFKNCLTYNRFHLIKRQKRQQTEKEQINRRRFRRIAEQRKVLIRTCDELGVMSGDFAERALTVDYSQGGMRIVINQAIPVESLLLFDFDIDFFVPRLQGIAELRWFKKLADSHQGVEAGLLFKDSHSQSVLALEMDH